MKKVVVIVLSALLLLVPLGGGSAQAQQARRFKVKAEVSSSKIISGQTVFITGKVKPLAIGRNVILQKRYKKHRGTWRNVMVAKVLADGHFRLRDTPSTGRKRWYRVVKPAGDGHRKGISHPMKVKVKAWDGRVDVKLFWESGADLNLVVEDPDWKAISAAKPGPANSGGEFDSASTTGCGGPGSFEHVSWPGEDAPVGHYYVSIDTPQPNPCAVTGAPWRLEVRVSGRLVKTIIGSGADSYVYGFGDGPIW